MLHLRKHLLPLIRAASHPPTTAFSSLLHRRVLLSTAAAAIRAPFSVEEYLVGTCGFTRAQALKASKKLSRLKSASNADAVLALLSSVGLSRPDIAAVVAADPLLLRSEVGVISYRLASLRDSVGLSDPQIALFLLSGGVSAIRTRDVAPNLKYLIPFFGSLEKLLQIVRKNNVILISNLDRVLKPNIAMLQERGLSVCDIAKVSQAAARLLVFNPERVKVFLLRADKIGVPESSSEFKYAVAAAACMSEDNFDAKMEFLRSTLGCSMEKLCMAVRKKPQILLFSQETLGRKIEFMINEVGLAPDYILERPVMLSYSLQKRMLPRHRVVKALQMKGLMKRNVSFGAILGYGESSFTRKYIGSYKDSLPRLADAYAAVQAGKCLSKSTFE